MTKRIVNCKGETDANNEGFGDKAGRVLRFYFENIHVLLSDALYVRRRFIASPKNSARLLAAREYSQNCQRQLIN